MKFNFQTALTDVATYDREGVGTLRFERERIYRWVQNAVTNVTFSAGEIPSHVFTSGTTATRSVIKMATANLGFMAGVVMATALSPNTGTNPSCYGWLQVYGPGSASVSGATTGGTDIAAGDYLKGSNGTFYAVRDAATQPTYGRNLQILQAVTTTTTPAAALVSVFVRCLQ